MEKYETLRILLIYCVISVNVTYH